MKRNEGELNQCNSKGLHKFAFHYAENVSEN